MGTCETPLFVNEESSPKDGAKLVPAVATQLSSNETQGGAPSAMVIGSAMMLSARSVRRPKHPGGQELKNHETLRPAKPTQPAA
jgi:hypothetical protein